MSNGFRTSLSTWHRVREIIEKQRAIDKWDLMQKAGISRSVYEKEAPLWKTKFSDFVEYDRKSGMWLAKIQEQESIEPEQTILIQTDWESEL